MYGEWEWGFLPHSCCLGECAVHFSNVYVGRAKELLYMCYIKVAEILPAWKQVDGLFVGPHVLKKI